MRSIFALTSLLAGISAWNSAVAADIDLIGVFPGKAVLVINGGTVRMLVDTGASMIALPATDAMRLGIDYKKGQLGYSSTANGIKPVYRVKLDTVKVGDIQLNQVDATVHEGGLPIVLLGMSFLNRTEIRREGELLTLSKRY